MRNKRVRPKPADLPILDGATALYPLYAAFTQAVYPEKEYGLYTSEVTLAQGQSAWNILETIHPSAFSLIKYQGYDFVVIHKKMEVFSG